MDLAKIRKKGRQELSGARPPDQAAAGTAAAKRLGRVFRRRPARGGEPTPLEIILAGREAAGCGAGTTGLDRAQIPDPAAGKEEVLCFRISSETFGINIMQIKEILKSRPVTEVPRAPSFVSGVISLRGVILPVIDMHERLGLEHPPTSGRERLVVVKTGPAGDLAGLLVDQVLQVAGISGAVEPAPPILAGIDRDFVLGIGRSDNRIIILLNPERLAELQPGEEARP